MAHRLRPPVGSPNKERIAHDFYYRDVFEIDFGIVYSFRFEHREESPQESASPGDTQCWYV